MSVHVCMCISAYLYFILLAVFLLFLITQLLPVAPLYGDVQINLPMLVKTLPHHDSSRWTCTSDHVEEKVSISIITKMDQIRSEHVGFISKLARYNNEVNIYISTLMLGNNVLRCPDFRGPNVCTCNTNGTVDYI